MTAWIDADWPAPPGVRAVTTVRHGLGVSMPPFDSCNLGIRNGDDPAAVAANRTALVDALRLPSAPRWLRQVHGTTVAREPGRDEPQADAAVTTVAGTVLAILTADCLPLVLAARDGAQVAVAHAGWRGLCAGVLEATVAAMDTAPADLIAWLGPAAGPDAYEIDAPVRDAFIAADPQAASAFAAARPGHWRMDLYAIARQRLSRAGIAAADVHGGGLCTISDPRRFFSHRRDGRGGRIATLAWMSP